MKSNIDIKKLIDENRPMALVALAVLVLIIVYIAAFIPMANRLAVLSEECRIDELRAADVRNLVDMGRMISREYGGRTLLSEEQAAVGLEELTRYGRSMGIIFLSIRPRNVIAREGALYKIMPIELSFETKGEQFVKLMAYMDEMKKAIVTVKSFSVTADNKDRSELQVNMVINIYLSLGPTGSYEG